MGAGLARNWRGGRRAVLLAIAAFAAMLAACTQATPEKAPPRVVDGVLDVRGWDFEADGPVRLDGDWEVFPEGTLEGAEVWSAPSSGDFTGVPWGEAHHRSRGGRDLDASRWVELRVRVRVLEPSMGFALQFDDFSAESFYAECRNAEGAHSVLRAGIEGPRAATRFHEGRWPFGTLDLARESPCVVVVPRAALDRVRMLSAPSIDRAAFAPPRASLQSALLFINLAMVGTFAVFAATMVRLDRRDPVPKWSLAVAVLLFLRIFAMGRGSLFPPEGSAVLTTFPWWRLEYADLWLLFGAILRYGEALAGTRVHGRWAAPGTFGVLIALALAAPYSANKACLPAGELAGLVVLGVVVRALFRAPRTLTLDVALAGVVVACVGAVGSIVTNFATGRNSPPFEFLSSTEPLFQMSILALRAQEAREKSARLAQATMRFVPQEFLQALGHPDVSAAKVGDVTSRVLTILFADLRNFTRSSERMSPEEAFAFLNECLARVAPAVRRHEGFIDKYIGDAIMALFPRCPADALRAALAMQGEISAHNARHPARQPLALGIGLHVGPVMMGTVGEAERLEVTVISDAVNLTARLESLTKQLGCAHILSGEVFEALDDGLRVGTRRLGTFVVKGRSTPVELHECFGSDPAPVRDAKAASRARFHAMLDTFESGRIAEAADLAGSLRDACPDDGPAAWWHIRLTREVVEQAEGALSRGGVIIVDEK